MHVYEVYMYTCECVCALGCSLTRHRYIYLDGTMHFLGDVISFGFCNEKRIEFISVSVLRFPFSVANGLCGKSLRCVSFVTAAWMECFVFIV